MDDSNKYFEFLSTEDERKQLISDYANHKCSNKTHKINPDWLTYSFVVTEFKWTTDLDQGVVRIYPVDDLVYGLYSIDKHTNKIIDDGPKHLVVRLEIGAL